MTKCEKVQIIEVTGEGFKGFKERRVFTFDEGTNTFIGENGQGKSSIGDLIVWVFTGKNNVGKNKDLNIINKDSEVAIGTVSFLDDMGEIHVVERKQSTNTTVKFDDKRTTQKKLEELISTEIFLLIFNPMYFLSLDADNSRKVVYSLIPDIEKDDVLAELNPSEKEFLEAEHFEIDTTNEYLKNRRAELNEMDDQEKYAVGYMAKLEETIVIPEAVTFDDTKIEAVEKELEILNQGKPVLRNLSDLLMKKSEFDKQIAVINGERFESEKVKLGLLNDKALLEQKIKMENSKEYKPVDSSQLETQVKVLQNNYLHELKQSKAIDVQMQEVANKRTHFHAGDQCPSCKQMISEQAVASLNQELQNQAKVENGALQEKQNGLKMTLAELEEKGKNLVQHISQAKKVDDANRQQFEKQKQEAIQSLTKELNEVIAKLNNLKGVEAEFEFKKQAKVHAVMKEIEALQLTNLENENKQIQKAFDDKLRQDRRVLQETLMNLRKEKEAVLKHESQRQALMKQADNNNKELEKKKVELEALKKKGAHIQNQISFMKVFNSQKTAILNRTLSKHLDAISIKLEKAVQSTGEIKDCFEILYKGKELNVCSTSETIKAGLEVSQMIRELSGLNYPVFVDNGESITTYESKASQTIETKVVKGSKLSIVKDDTPQEIGITPAPVKSKSKGKDDETNVA